VEFTFVFSLELVDDAENLVGGAISAAAFPPAFDDAAVVAMDCDVRAMFQGVKDGANKEFESDSFCPSDVTSVTVSAGEEAPCAPVAADSDANTHG
jgi:hypothetical protein